MVFSIVYINYFVKNYFSITTIKDFFKETIFTMNLIENLNLSSNQSEFEGDIKFTLSHFKNVILLPTIYSIYKMTYFATEYSAFLKYNTYRIVL